MHENACILFHEFNFVRSLKRKDGSETSTKYVYK